MNPRGRTDGPHQPTRLAIILLAAAVTACTSVAMSPSASITTTMPGWERYFRLEWTAQPSARGTEIDGYVYNTYGSPAGRVRLLVQALDASNNVVAQRIEWVPGGVPNFGRSYFRISALPPAEQYRVTVWSFDIIETDDFRRLFP